MKIIMEVSEYNELVQKVNKTDDRHKQFLLGLIAYLNKNRTTINELISRLKVSAECPTPEKAIEELKK